MFFAQRMLHDDSPTKRKAASALAETRMALTSLKSFKRRNIANVPVQRVGDSIRSVVPGVVRQQGGNHENRMPPSNVMLQIYEVSIFHATMCFTTIFVISQFPLSVYAICGSAPLRLSCGQPGCVGDAERKTQGRKG